MAINVVVGLYTAIVADFAELTVPGEVLVEAPVKTVSTANAVSDVGLINGGSQVGPSLGLGASISLNISTQVTVALLAGAIFKTAPVKLTVKADADHIAMSIAKAGGEMARSSSPPRSSPRR